MGIMRDGYLAHMHDGYTSVDTQLIAVLLGTTLFPFFLLVGA
jgi:hypothetical protein